jgi:hypothetical protein
MGGGHSSHHKTSLELTHVGDASVIAIAERVCTSTVNSPQDPCLMYKQGYVVHVLENNPSPQEGEIFSDGL